MLLCPVKLWNNRFGSIFDVRRVTATVCFRKSRVQTGNGHFSRRNRTQRSATNSPSISQNDRPLYQAHQVFRTSVLMGDLAFHEQLVALCLEIQWLLNQNGICWNQWWVSIILLIFTCNLPVYFHWLTRADRRRPFLYAGLSKFKPVHASMKSTVDTPWKSTNFQ